MAGPADTRVDRLNGAVEEIICPVCGHLVTADRGDLDDPQRTGDRYEIVRRHAMMLRGA